MLHVVAGFTDGDLSAGVEVQNLMQGGGAVALEKSVQARNGVVPLLEGMEMVTAEAPLNQRLQLQLNTWRSTNYLVALAERLSLGQLRQPHENVPTMIGLDLEADWTAKGFTTGATDSFFLYRLAYPPFIPSRGGVVIMRTGNLTAADYSTTGAFGTAATIEDLDPNKTYRIHGIGGFGVTDVGILRLSAPSFQGKVLQAIIRVAAMSMTYFPRDSLLVDGVERLSIQASGSSAAAGNRYVVLFEEYGPRGSSAARVGGGRTGRNTSAMSGAETTRQETTGGANRGLLSRLMR